MADEVTNQPTQVGFFTDDKGNASSMRIMSVVTVISGIVLMFVAVVLSFLNKTADIGPNMVAGSLGMIGIGLGAKVGQKIIESKQ